jgi:hypothetical protein
MNEMLKRKHVQIELKDEREISAKEVRISNDSVSRVDQRTDEEAKASIRQLVKIVLKSHLLGFLEGLGLGLVGGGGLGILVGSALDPPGPRGSFGSLAGLILGAGTGTLVGLATGLIVGHTYYYEFPMTEQSDSLQIGRSPEE